MLDPIQRSRRVEFNSKSFCFCCCFGSAVIRLNEWFSIRGNFTFWVSQLERHSWHLVETGNAANILQCTGRLPPTPTTPRQRILQSKILIVWRLRKLGLNQTLGPASAVSLPPKQAHLGRPGHGEAEFLELWSLLPLPMFLPQRGEMPPNPQCPVSVGLPCRKLKILDLEAQPLQELQAGPGWS